VSTVSIVDQLEDARVIFGLIEDDPDLQSFLASFGYNEAKLAEGQALLQAALNARDTAHAAFGDQFGLTDQLLRQRQELTKMVSKLKATIKTIYPNDRDMLATTGIRSVKRANVKNSELAESEANKPRQASRSQAALLDQARTLYNAALSDLTLLAELESIGYSRQRLEQEQQLIDHYMQLDVLQEARKSEARLQAARQREQVNAIKDWLKRMRKLARINKPDQINLLGKLRA
jgi:hypothetical protein